MIDLLENLIEKMMEAEEDCYRIISMHLHPSDYHDFATDERIKKITQPKNINECHGFRIYGVLIIADDKIEIGNPTFIMIFENA